MAMLPRRLGHNAFRQHSAARHARYDFRFRVFVLEISQIDYARRAIQILLPSIILKATLGTENEIGVLISLFACQIDYYIANLTRRVIILFSVGVEVGLNDNDISLRCRLRTVCKPTYQRNGNRQNQNGERKN